MPMYQYECEECGNTATKLKKMHDRDEPIRCEGADVHNECGSTMIRVTALPGPPRFNGPGFTPKFHR
jgi:putative FmdB family regulatory protein